MKQYWRRAKENPMDTIKTKHIIITDNIVGTFITYFWLFFMMEVHNQSENKNIK